METLTSMDNLALTYCEQGRLDEAEELNLEVMEKRKILGADHPDTLTSMNNLSFIWKAMGEQTQALKLTNECVRLRKQVLGDTHPHFLSSSAALSRWLLEGDG
jgi:Tetratricopeptide repeat